MLSNMDILISSTKRQVGLPNSPQQQSWNHKPICANQHTTYKQRTRDNSNKTGTCRRHFSSFDIWIIRVDWVDIVMLTSFSSQFRYLYVITLLRLKADVVTKQQFTNDVRIIQWRFQDVVTIQQRFWKREINNVHHGEWCYLPFLFNNIYMNVLQIICVA